MFQYNVSSYYSVMMCTLYWTPGSWGSQGLFFLGTMLTAQSHIVLLVLFIIQKTEDVYNIGRYHTMSPRCHD